VPGMGIVALTYTQTLHTHGCPNVGLKGIHGGGGEFLEMVDVETKHCYPLSDSVDLSLAALIEPLALTSPCHVVTVYNLFAGQSSHSVRYHVLSNRRSST
jgi:threonine dehydrogenase-like Zn-dependent dehydrogenase